MVDRVIATWHLAGRMICGLAEATVCTGAGQAICSGLGLTLALVSAVVAWRALAATWRQYGTGPVFPPLARAQGWAASLWHRLTPWRKQAVTVRVGAVEALAATDSARATVRVGFAPDLTLEQKVERLIGAYQSLGKEVASNWEASNQAHVELTNRLERSRAAQEADHAQLEKMAKEIAVSDVRPQLLALFLVAVGSIVQALPSLVCWFCK